MALGIRLLWGSRGRRFPMLEVALYQRGRLVCALIEAVSDYGRQERSCGFGVQIPGFGVGFWVSEFGFGLGFGFLVSGFGFRVLSFRFRVSGLGLGFGCRDVSRIRNTYHP